MTDRQRYFQGKIELTRRRRVLIGALLAVFALSGWLVGGVETVAFLGAVMAGLFVVSPRINAHWVMRLHRARPVSPYAGGRLHRILAALAHRADLARVPDLYWVPTRRPDAFATGEPGHAAIAVSQGSLDLLDERELAGVLAHEVAHIANGDARLTLFTESVRQMITTTAFVGLGFIIALTWSAADAAIPFWVPIVLSVGPGISFLIQRALSRTSELAADTEAVALTGDPSGLASALVKIDRATRNPWMQLLGLGRDGDVPSLLQTHPAIGERIERLLSLETPRPRPRPRPATGHRIPVHRTDGSRFHHHEP